MPNNFVMDRMRKDHLTEAHGCSKKIKKFENLKIKTSQKGDSAGHCPIYIYNIIIIIIILYIYGTVSEKMALRYITLKL